MPTTFEQKHLSASFRRGFHYHSKPSLQLPKIALLFQSPWVLVPLGISVSLAQQVATSNMSGHVIAWHHLKMSEETKLNQSRPWLITSGGWFYSSDFRFISSCHLQASLLTKLSLGCFRVTSRGWRCHHLRKQNVSYSDLPSQNKVPPRYSPGKLTIIVLKNLFLCNSLSIRWKIICMQHFWQLFSSWLFVCLWWRSGN